MLSGRGRTNNEEKTSNEKVLDRNAPMFRSRTVRGRGVGLARGRATVNRARGQQRGRTT